LSSGRGLSELRADTTVAFEPGWNAADTALLGASMDTTDSKCQAPTWSGAGANDEQRPVNCVSWPDAYAFCIWDGGFLPSDAEWMYAAAGGTEQREYPWGAAPPGETYAYAIYGIGTLCTYPTGMLAPCKYPDSIAPVGTATLGVGLWGQLDLVGNVAEWNLDSPGAVFETPLSDLSRLPCNDCVYQEGSFHVMRGGGFDDVAKELSTQAATSAQAHMSNLGFRCARSP
jgi:formylglycine-generating enzyme required for sulfatase activity